MIHDLRCQVTGVVVGTIELPDNMPADEVLRRTYTHSGVVSGGVKIIPPVPETATPATVRIALRKLHGVTNAQLDAIVNQIIASLPTQDQRDDAETLWMYSVSIQRTHPLVAAVATVLGLNNDQIDDVFRLANTI